jgi:hypothetical protein
MNDSVPFQLAPRAFHQEETMSRESRIFAGILLVILPSVMFGGLSLLSF